MARSSRRNYNRISADQGVDTSDVTQSNVLDEPLSPSSSFANEDDINNTPLNDGENLLVIEKASPAIPPIYHEINVVVMDAAQSRFNIKCDAQWKVSEFKEASASVTKVPPQAQRLIHMGKLLQDESTLGDFGINENAKIIHLFPKPNVVINSSSSNDQDGQNNDQTSTNADGEGGASEGAHVPQIVLDAEEASRRSQILILSSQEIFEAQHRVKILSFLLMIISSMELLTLMTLFVGVQAEDPTGYGGGSAGSLPPGNPTDTPPSSNNASMQMRTWQNSDYFDTLISAFGFYVALLGIKATSENTIQLANRYCLCLVVVGIGYNCYYYYTNIQQEEKHAQERNQQIGSTELYTTAFIGILLPLTVWLLCIMRAFQFQSLIREAEVEAEERTRGLNAEGGSSDNITGEGETLRSLPYGSDDLELAAERGVSS